MKINKINKILKIAALPALAVVPIVGLSNNVQNNNIVKADTNLVSYTFENWTIDGGNATMRSVVEVENQELSLLCGITLDETNKKITVNSLEIDQSITTGNMIDLEIGFSDVKNSDGQKYYVSSFGDGSTNVLDSSGLETYPWLNGVSITCPKYLQSINQNAFNFNSISDSAKFKGITFNSALVYIMDNAFKNCAYITQDIIIPSGTRSVGANAFELVGSESTNKPKLVISEGVWYIGNSAFLNADFENDFNIPSSIIYIGEKAFGVTEASKAKNITLNMTNFSQYNYTSTQNTDYFYGLTSLYRVNAKIYVASSVRKNIEDASKNTTNSIWTKYVDSNMIKSIANTNSVVGGIIVGVSVAILLVAFGIAIYRNKKNRPQSPKPTKVEKEENKVKTKTKSSKTTKK